MKQVEDKRQHTFLQNTSWTFNGLYSVMSWYKELVYNHLAGNILINRKWLCHSCILYVKFFYPVFFIICAYLVWLLGSSG
jgi:hypothetical protein